MSPPETWLSWATRITGELAHLGEGEGLTFTVRPGPPTPSTYAAERAPRRWLRSGAAGSGSLGRPARVPDVLVQARVVEGVLALECISDTEFEGLSELTRADVATLVGLGWEGEGSGSELSRVLGGGWAGEGTSGAGISGVAGPGAVASEAAARKAAELLRASLAGVLGAASPDDVDLRRITRR
ncbi:MAG: hypothetical protein JWP82_1938 [Humibacillus sp.]|nr:hypothetical protein [Humibacillus sp.]